MIKVSDSKHRWREDWEMWFDRSESLCSHGNIILLKWKSTGLTETNHFANASPETSTRKHHLPSPISLPQGHAASVLGHTDSRSLPKAAPLLPAKARDC